MSDRKEKGVSMVEKAVCMPFDGDTPKDMYNDWATTYNNDTKLARYNGPEHLIELFLSFNFEKKSKILDVLGGTGALAELLSKHGYSNIDNLDASEKMLLEARKLDLYNHYIFCYIGGSNVIPVLNDTYDYAILCGGFTPGHVTSDIFPEIIRILKPGGMFLWGQAEKYILDNKEFQDFHEDVLKLVAAKKWKLVIRKKVDNFIFEKPGFVYAMQKL